MGERLPLNPNQDGDDPSLSPRTNDRSILGTDTDGATRRILVDSSGSVNVSVKENSISNELLRELVDKLSALRVGIYGELLVQSGSMGTSYVYAYPYATLSSTALITQYENTARTAMAWAVQAQSISYV
jgi:hypothetical protein